MITGVWKYRGKSRLGFYQFDWVSGFTTNDDFEKQCVEFLGLLAMGHEYRESPIPGEEGTFNVRKGEDFLYRDDEDDWYGSYDSFYFKRSEVVNFFPELDMNVPDNEPEIGALSKKVEREQNWRGKDTALKMIAGMAIALFESSKDFHSGGNLSINRVSAQVIENNIIFGNDEDSDTHPDTFRRLLTNALDKYAPKFKKKATKKRPK
ncbi:hypothetical protein [Escherichia coli]|uniref:hypothetical protein n=1 Tax=Escherichia coli TaxID=562 RepID=UPI001FCE9674|nr:hypothetical protein [Escherichia coli]